MNASRPSPRPFFLALAAALFLCGCAGYKLGPTSGVSARETSIQINPFSNHTLEPRLTDAVTAALRRRLQREGTYRLANDSADVIVSGELTRYERQGVGVLSHDVLTTTDYQVVLTAQVTARKAGTGELIFSGPITGRTLVQVGSDLSSAERQALPILADDLAVKIADALTDKSW